MTATVLSNAALEKKMVGSFLVVLFVSRVLQVLGVSFRSLIENAG